MSAPRPRPAGKSITPTPNPPRAAEPAAPQTAVGEPKGAARKGAPSALRPDPQTGDGRYPVAWLHIVAPRGATPTATSKCLCGRDRSAVGHRRVLALITDHTAHRDTCPLRSTQEGRTAA
ncbi:hypothetical protein PV729_40765 [Streptomyces europaeiscabiei]|uniref:Uncharacterized protein n=1 Tax=Streptomyces europaeiscabiei TaxID=146819 RepID=A0ABU4NV86_9ACTN|nr:hypothetical protein [Streptomyces europaeiscabiei]MDX3549649.1 hypothetical protein [Streptomyces europaeiscabiei]MDX3557982.1 hypothetical protein [Streptomyces europaeiscabiei]MDX3706938.1 hypothetical protein [Streptomyces europaeiscabiei]